MEQEPGSRAAAGSVGRSKTRIRSWRSAAEQGVGTVCGAAVSAYDRRRVLPRLIAMDFHQLDDDAADPGPAIRGKLKRALRAERGRGRAGHWAYDLNRHLALLQAIEGESELARRAGRPV